MAGGKRLHAPANIFPNDFIGHWPTKREQPEPARRTHGRFALSTYNQAVARCELTSAGGKVKSPGIQVVAVVLAATQLLAGCATSGIDRDSADPHGSAPQVPPDRAQTFDESVAEPPSLGAIFPESLFRKPSAISCQPEAAGSRAGAGARIPSRIRIRGNPFPWTAGDHETQDGNPVERGAEIGISSQHAFYSRSEGTGRRWHVDLAVRTGYLKLSSTEQKLDRRLELPLSLGTFNVFQHSQTPIDRNTGWGLSTFYLGVGREESDRFIWTAYAGAGAWRDRTSQRALIGKLSVRFRYATYYAGLTTELYPWGTPRYDRDLTWAQGLAASRPFVLAGAELGFVNARGAGDLKLLGLKVYKDSQGIRDWVFAGRLGVGWALPMGEHWSFNLTGDYTHHLYRPEEYNSWNVTTVLRYRF